MKFKSSEFHNFYSISLMHYGKCFVGNFFLWSAAIILKQTLINSSNFFVSQKFMLSDVRLFLVCQFTVIILLCSLDVLEGLNVNMFEVVSFSVN